MIDGTKSDNINSRLKYGMAGGGEGAFIGDVHRKSIALDGKAELVAGVFSRDFKNTTNTGASLGIAANRLYKNFEEMAEAEANRGDGIDFVCIVTPNNTHFPIV